MDTTPFYKRKIIKVLAVAAVVAAVAVGLVFVGWVNKKDTALDSTTGVFAVKRSDLIISVTESGDIKPVNSIDIKSEVEGRTTIISIVDEGTCITAEDVNNGMVLVELDSSDIKQKLTERKVSFLNAEAGFTEAKESLDIQEKQNESDIQAGKMKATFSLMDLRKYLGKNVADKRISATKEPADGQGLILKLIEDKDLGGEALQKLRELVDNITLANEKFARANDRLEWTRKLAEKNYVSKSELRGDELEARSLEIKKDQAETALELFKLYEFPKQTQKLLSDYHESKRDLERINARARSKLAQAKAKHESKEATHNLQKERLEKLEKQLVACVIKAPAAGEVVYSSSTDRWARRNRPIEIGGEIRERQKIISIPDTSAMKVEIKIHETWIDKIELDQKAIISFTAFPEKEFEGQVIKKSPMADPENWMNPDLKVYTTDVSVEGTHDFLKTGMTAKVKVIIAELSDVLSVPIQTVVNIEDEKVCYVSNDGEIKKRIVETGSFNDNFVEIKTGLAEGEKVLLVPPRIIESEVNGQ